MCRRIRCDRCGKATWAGCGAHVDAVMRGVPDAERCACERAASGTGRGLLSRAPAVLLVVLAIGMALAFLGCRTNPETYAADTVPPAAAAKVTTGDAQALVDEGALLLDVRTPEEFAAGHLPGAVNFPVQRLEAGERLPYRTGRKIVVYCQSGRRSARAAEALKGQGFEALYDLGPKPETW